MCPFPPQSQNCICALPSLLPAQVALEDSMVTMSAILSSRFVSGIRVEVEKVERQLNLFTETLDEWVAVQKAWVYLEPIFRCSGGSSARIACACASDSPGLQKQQEPCAPFPNSMLQVAWFAGRLTSSLRGHVLSWFTQCHRRLPHLCFIDRDRAHVLVMAPLT